LPLPPVELYPLVIAVDDLQWADQPSWQVLKALYDPLSDHPLYLILVYKNDLQEYREKVTAMLADLAGNEPVEEIKPEALTAGDITAMLAGIFDGNFDDLHELAQLVYRKTAGNPLYIQQVLNLFLENKGIYYDPETKVWRLDRDKAGTVNLPDRVADLISSKIDNLSPGTRELLEIAACAGSSFTPAMLSLITGYPTDYLEEQLGTLCRSGLIVETGAGYEFFHNRIRQNAYEQIEPDRKEKIHYRIATALLKHPDQTFIEANLLSITAHLLHCPQLIKREGTGAWLTLPLYRAGMMAKQSAAVERALKLFSLAEELLEESPWQKDYHHTLRLKLELAECRFICGRYNEAERNFAEMLARAACEQDLAAIKKRYMLLNSYTGDPGRVIALGLEALKHLGFSLHTRRLKFRLVKEILHGSFLFRNSRLEAIKNAPPITGERLADALEVLTIMAASANLIDKNLFSLIVLKIGNLSAKYGNSPYAPLGYAAYSMVLGSVLGNFTKGEKLQNIALSLAEQFDEEHFDATTYFCIGSYVAHWTAPAWESFAYLQKAFHCAMGSGDYLYCCYTLMIMLEMKHSMGVPLAELEEMLKLPEKYPRELSNDLLRRALVMFQEHIRLLSLKGTSPEDSPVEVQEMAKLNTNEVMIYHLLKI
jgi:predicted ATPase